MKFANEPELDDLLATMELVLTGMCGEVYKSCDGNFHQMYTEFRAVLDKENPAFLAQIAALLLAKHAQLVGLGDD